MKKLGNVNAADIVIISNNKKIIAYCIDTPNSISYAIAKLNSLKIKYNSITDRYNLLDDIKTFKSKYSENITNFGWFNNDKDANFSFKLSEV